MTTQSPPDFPEYSCASNSWVNIYIAPGPLGEPPVTELVRYDQFVTGLFKPGSIKEQKLHAALGVCGEAGELGDAIKKEVIYGKHPDRANIVEELGDLMFYAQAVKQLYHITDQEMYQTNADKLAKRYVGLKYSDRAAQERADKNDPPVQAS